MIKVDLANSLDALESLSFEYEILPTISIENVYSIFTLNTLKYMYAPTTFVENSYNNIYEFWNLDNILIQSISLFSTSEFITTMLIFNFMQLLILTVISELVWPTQLFNRQNFINYGGYRLRTFTEVFCKSNVFKKLNKFLL